MKTRISILCFLFFGLSGRINAADKTWQLAGNSFDWIQHQQSGLSEEGLHLYFDYWGVFLANPVGGSSQYAAYTHELVFGGTLDLQKVVGWNDASLTISIGDAAGHNLSENIGNFFTVSQAYVMNTFSFYNFFLEQKLFEKKLELKAGRMTAGQLFATLPAFGLQVNGGINGNPSSLFVNSPFSSGISAPWAGYAKFEIHKEFHVAAGIFQASPRLDNPAYHGIDFSIRPGDGFLTMLETKWTPVFKEGQYSKDGKSISDPGLPGIYKLGGYYSNYTFDNFLGGSESNAFGFYGMAQQMVWRSASNPNRNFSLWGGLTYSPQIEFSQMPIMGFAGAIWQGVFPGRDQDQFLFDWQIGGFSRLYADSVVNTSGGYPTYETVFDFSYIFTLNEHLSIQPDIQYIVRPGGFGSIPNALVIGMQVSLVY